MLYKKKKTWQNLIDIYNCRVDINDESTIKNIVNQIIDDLELHSLKQINYLFPNQGITSVDILSESHLIIHTWPEFKYISIDLFSCSKKLKIKKNYFKQLFKSNKVLCKNLKHIISM